MKSVRYGALVLIGTACSTGTVACGGDSSSPNINVNVDGGAGFGGVMGSGGSGTGASTTDTGGESSSGGAVATGGVVGSGGSVGSGGAKASGGTTSSAGGSSNGSGGMTSAGSGGANSGGTSGNAGEGGTAGAGDGGSAGASAGGSGGGGGTSSGGGGGATGGSGGTATGGSGGTATGGSGGTATGGSGGAAGGTGGTATGGTGGTATGGTGGTATGGTGGTATGGTGGTGGTATGGTGGTGCGADDTACALSGNVSGFCRTNVCTACSGASDNASCSAAYGSGTGYVCVSGNCTAGDCITTADCPSGGICGIGIAHECGKCTGDPSCVQAYGAGYLCTAAGSCVQGDCKADSDCTTGQICGVAKANNCGKCTTDTECKNDATYGASFICNTATGACVAGTCAQNNKSCPANGSDFCCGGGCVDGDCCVAGDCASMGNNFACVNHACTLCALATNNTYYVDPVNGSDTIGTGSSSSAACAFKTIARALTVIGGSPNPNTKVLVASTGNVGTGSGETFPIVVPANVTIGAATTAPTVLVPAGLSGFSLTHASSGLSDLIIDGQNHTAASGVLASAGSADTTRLTNVTVKNMTSDGIRVSGTGVLSIGAGVSSTGNGVAGNGAADGLRLNDQAKVTIAVPSGSAPSHFDSNSAHGIFVTGNASVTITGVPGTAGAGTVTANSNVLAGVWIEQAITANPAMNSITGLVAWANKANGIRAVAGSAVTLRSSFVLANATNGIIVSTHNANGTTSNDISHMDFGSVGSIGANLLQSSLGQNPNGGAGICLAIARNAGVTLKAQGNVFSGPRDCSKLNAGTVTRNTTCANAVDISLNNAASNNMIDVTSCQ